MAKAKTNVVDIDKMFQTVNVPAKSKSKIPVIAVDKIVLEAVKQYIETKKEIDNLNVKLDINGSIILAETSKKYESSKGEIPSYKIESTAGMVTISYKNAFSKPGDDPELLEHEKCNEYFQKKRAISIKAEKLEDNETISFLIEKIGMEKFSTIFDLKQELVAKDDLNVTQFDAPEEIKKFIKQYKAAIKC